MNNECAGNGSLGGPPANQVCRRGDLRLLEEIATCGRETAHGLGPSVLIEDQREPVELDPHRRVIIDPHTHRASPVA